MTRKADTDDAIATVESIREAVCEALALHPDELDEHDNLFEHGLESLSLIRLCATWRRAGLPARFEVLAERPTLADWARALTPIERPVDTAGDRSGDPPAGGASGLVHIAPSGPFDPAPLQRAYRVGRDVRQPFGGVAAHFFAELDGHDIDPVRLDAAVRALFARHDMLRVRTTPDGRCEILAETPHAHAVVRDLRDTESPEPVLEELRNEYTHRSMDVDSGQVFEVALTLLPEGRTRLHVDLDMIAADALSMRVLLDDLQRLYDDGPDTPLPQLPMRYPDYLRTLAGANAERRAEDRGWWRSRLDELPDAPALPIRRHADARGPARTRRLHHHVTAERARTFTARAREHGTTPAAALATAFAESVGEWSAAPRFLLNLPLFAREPLVDGVDRLVGDFSSSVLVDVDLSVPDTIAGRAHGIAERMRTAIGHASYTGVEVLHDLSRHRGAVVLAPVVYTSALGLGELYGAAFRDRFGDPSHIVSQGPQVWLDAQVTELDGGFLLNWDVRDDIFELGVADAAFDAYRRLVDRLVDDPIAWERPAGLGLPAEQRARRELVARPERSIEPDTLHGPFFRRAADEPHRPAIVGCERLGHGALAASARSVAGWLRAHGARTGDTVSITLPRGAAQLTAVLGALAAGCSYLPIPPEQPAARSVHVRRLGRPVAHLDEATLRDALAHEPIDPVPVSPDDIAYVLFTSGSTGVPKGVEVSHAAAVNTIESILRRLDAGAELTTIALAALEFDMSVFDLFAPLRRGGRVVVLREDERRDAEAWRRLVDEHGVTVWNSVPALVTMLLDAAGPPIPDSLGAVLLGGDLVPVDLPARVRAAAPTCRFVALGGMTEAAIHSTWQEVDASTDLEGGVPWGTPLDNVRCRVVGHDGRDRPDLVPGELWVGGASLARGYRGDPALTSERFVTDAEGRWYRTGDGARYRPDGALEFLGRLDGQVQLHGFRIELGEIEAALRAHPTVDDAVVILDESGPRPVLAAAVTPSDAASAPDSSALVSHLRARLPAHMVCGRIGVLHEIPLSANGKVRRELLGPLIAEATPEVHGRPPEGPAETLVARVWATLVAPERPVRAQDTFFDIGGDSLLATRAVAALRRAGASGASVAGLLGGGDLASYAAALRLSEGGTEDPVVPRPAERSGPFAATPVQEAYRIGRDPRLPLGGVGTWQYAEFDGPVDAARLERCWSALVRRHEMLRTVFTSDGRLRILDHVPDWTLPRVRVADEAALLRHRDEASHVLTDLTRWPLWDVRLVEHPSGTRLTIGLDYILFDALSIMTLFTELDALYADPTTAFPPIELSVRDYREQVHADPRRRADDEAYWRQRLESLPPGPSLPLTAPVAALPVPRFERREHLVPPVLVERLRGVASEHGVTLSTLLLVLYGEVLGRWSEQPDLTITLTMFDRREVHPDAHRVLGDFTTVSLADHRHDPDDLARSARALQARLAEDLDHREVDSAWLLRELSRRSGRLESVPVVFTSALGVGDAAGRPLSMDMSGAFPRRGFGISQAPQVMLDNQVTASSRGLLITWDSVCGAFADGVADAMFGTYIRSVERAAGAGLDAARSVLRALPTDQDAIRTEANDTGSSIPPRALHDAFVERATASPEPTALSWWQDGERHDLARGELLGRARRVAAALAERGVGRGDRVGVCLPKGPDQIVVVLGVSMSGASYVPLGVDLPAARRARITEHASLSLTVTEPLEPSTPELPEPPVVDPASIAYTIFTSGTTGTPKGVEVSHEAAWNTLADIDDRFDVGPDDAVLALSALDFDLSVWDVFGVLGAGGRLVLPTEDERRDAQRWVTLVHDGGVTLWNSVPLLLDMLLTAAERAPGTLARLRIALASGDWVGLDLFGRLRDAAPDGTLVALGGATEAAVWSNLHVVDEVPEHWVSVPYGRPLAGQCYRVVDADGDERPDHVVGELWIGGAGLAHGYLGDRGLTEQRFVERDGRRWYRTGDLGRALPDGTLEFLGRLDARVKLGGLRIELGEVESALCAHDGVARAAVAVQGSGGTARLVGAVVPRDPALDAHARRHLEQEVLEVARRWLPAPAVPRALSVIPALPLNRNGKPDGSAIAHLLRNAPGVATSSGPTSDTARWVGEQWADLLDVPVPGGDDGFFTVGGNSLAALSFIERVRRRYGVDLTVREFLAQPQLAATAEAIERLLAAPAIDPTGGDAPNLDEGVL